MTHIPPLRRRKLTAVAVFALVAIVVPIAGTGLMLWSFLGRSDALASVPVAVVNADQPVTVGSGDSSKTVAAGRQLAAELTKPDVPGQYELNWVLTDADDAADGLADGSYHAVLTIPEPFSEAVTSTSSDTPVQAQIVVQSNDSADRMTATISEQVATAAADSLGDQASAAYLDNLFVGFNTISEQMGTAAGSATDLASGADSLASSTESIADGAQSLDVNMSTLESGAADVAAGSSSLAGGARGLADGAAQVAAGATGLASGSAELSQGMASVADASRGLAGSAENIAGFTAALSETCPDAAGAAYCARVRELTVRTRVHGLAANGLAQAQGDLAGASSSIAAAALDVADGTASVSTGTRELAQSAATLSDGAAGVSNGTGAATAGADELASATAQLVDGADSVASGSDALASSLTSGAQTVPTFTEAQRQTLQTVVTQPVVVDSQRTHTSGVQAWQVALVAAIVLWLGAIAASYLQRRLLPFSVVIPARSAVRAAVSTLSAVTAASILQSVAVWATLMFLGVPGPAAGETAALTLVAGATFTMIVIALRTVSRRYGILTAILSFAGQLLFASGLLPIQTAPAFFQILNPILPLTAYVNGMAGAISGSSTVSSAVGSVVVLLCWAAVSAAVAALVEQRRTQRTSSVNVDVPTWTIVMPERRALKGT